LLILRSHYAMIVRRGTYEGQSYALRRFRNPFYNAAVRRLARVKRAHKKNGIYALVGSALLGNRSAIPKNFT